VIFVLSVFSQNPIGRNKILTHKNEILYADIFGALFALVVVVVVVVVVAVLIYFEQNVVIMLLDNGNI
jgi:cytochrome b